MAPGNVVGFVRGRSGVEHDRRRLKAERFAAAGRQDNHTVAPFENGVHRFALKRAEIGEAPDAVERIEQQGVKPVVQTFLA
jgi:hypothetical protein